MPSLLDHNSQQAVKALLIGDSGSGKTGSLASLVEAGYNLHVLDYDNGLDTLVNVLWNKPQPEELLKRVKYETLTDKMKSQLDGTIIPSGKPTAFPAGMKLLNDWKVKDESGNLIEDLGPATSWGSDTVLVIDSLTMLSEAAMRHVLSVAGRLGQQPQIQDWGEAMRKVQGLLELLYSDSIKCNVVVTAHVQYVEGEEGGTKGYPATLGQKLPPKTGRYFNTVVMAKSTGTGQNVKRRIKTVSEGMIELKVSNPFGVQRDLPLETGMAELFKALKPGQAQADAQGAAQQSQQ